MIIKTPILILSAVLTCSCSNREDRATNILAEPQSDIHFTVRSLNFSDGAFIPDKFTSYGANNAPVILWEPGPKTAKSYVLLLEDPDAPGSKPFVHWLVIDIPSTQLRSGPKGTAENNSNGDRAYYGPHPPPGPPHRYVFEVFALDLPTISATNRDEAIKAMEGHVLAEGRLMGMSFRK